MSNEVIGFCPICKEKLIATKLSCRKCGLELSNEFVLNPFSYLTEKELQFIETFLKCRGNLKVVQKNLSISYLSAKKELDQVLHSLGYTESNDDYKATNNIEVILSELPIYEDESKIITALKKALNAQKGTAILPLSRGKSFQIYYEAFENGIIATNLPQNKVLTWGAFEAAIEIMEKNNGRAPKGQAMKSKLGEPPLTLDTIEGYVAYHAYGIKLGESVTRLISPLSAILQWSGVCRNGYGYLELI